MSSDGTSDTDEEILGTTTISDRWRISLIKDVRTAFAERDGEVAEGDLLVYKRRDEQTVIEVA